MKTKIVFSVFLSLFIWIGIIGCSDDNEIILEITPDSKNAVIQKEVDGIKFEFYLLNEEGISTTVFNEGENIIFSFSFNNLQDTIIVSTDFIDTNFYRVYQSNNIDLGKPWTGLWCEFSMLPNELKLASSRLMRLNCPWVLTSNSKPDYPLCMSESKNYLNVGNYYTYINLKYHYKINNIQKTIENIKFLINFKVE